MNDRNLIEFKNEKDLKKIVLAHAIYMGDFYSLQEFYRRSSQISRAFADKDISENLFRQKGLNRFLPHPSLLDDEEFKQIMSRINDQTVEKEAIPREIAENTGRQAFKLGKYSMASAAFNAIGEKDGYIGIVLEKADLFLKEHKADEGIDLYLRAAKVLEHDYTKWLGEKVFIYSGPIFQYTGPRLHEECLTDPGGCPETCITRKDEDDIIREGIKFLLDSSIAHLRHLGDQHQKALNRKEGLLDIDYELGKRILSAYRGSTGTLFKVLAEKQDYNYSEFVENYNEAVAKLRSNEDHIEVQNALMGHTTFDDNTFKCLKELSYQHPVGPLVVCIKKTDNQAVIIPAMRESGPLLDCLLEKDSQTDERKLIEEKTGPDP